jgi:hypothetical protein
VGARRRDHAARADRPAPVEDVRLGRAGTGRRALPHRLDAHGPSTTRRRGAGGGRPRRRRAAAARRRLAPPTPAGIDDRDDLPVLVRAGRHIARPKRYIRNYADEVEPDELVDAVRGRPPRRRLGQAGRRLDRPRPGRPRAGAGRARAASPRSPARTRPVRASRRTASARTRCATSVEAGIDCVEHATGLTEDTLPLFAERGRRQSSRR